MTPPQRNSRLDIYTAHTIPTRRDIGHRVDATRGGPNTPKTPRHGIQRTRTLAITVAVAVAVPDAAHDAFAAVLAVILPGVGAAQRRG